MKLTASWQFRKVYGTGEKLVCGCAVIFYYRNPEEGKGPRFGVVASKRVGPAVVRNRAKRLLREAARNLSGKLNHKDIWVVLVARSNIQGRTSKEVVDDIGKAMEKANLITRTE
ncbi:MAG: ribonuclease P protein component [Candidatus Latescibacterota bacterium]|jgi:ribonuclease P protein component